MSTPSGPRNAESSVEAFTFLQNSSLGMDSRTTSVLEAEHAGIFNVGLPRADAEMAALRAEGREQTIFALSEDVRRLDRPRRFNAPPMPNERAQKEIAALTPHRQKGLWINPFVRGIVLPVIITGAEDAPNSDFSRQITLAGKFRQELAEHVGLAQIPEEISTVEFAELLRERGAIEHTLATFLHRSALATGAMAVGAAAAFVHDLNNFSLALPSAAQPARRLYASHRGHLLASSPVTHTQMAQSAVFLMSQALTLPEGRRLRGPRRELLESMMRRQEGVVGDINRWEDFASTVMHRRQEAEQLSREQVTVTGPVPSSTTSAPAEAGHSDEAEAARRAAAREFIENLTIPELDAIILPSRREGRAPTAHDVREALGDEETRRVEAAHATEEHPVLWERVVDLAVITDLFGGELRRGRPETFNDRAPWYVATFERSGIRYAVATSPVYGRATYLVSERHVPGTPMEILEQRRDVARDVGAISVRHSVQHPAGDARVALLVRKLDELHAREWLGVQDLSQRNDNAGL